MRVTTTGFIPQGLSHILHGSIDFASNGLFGTSVDLNPDQVLINQVNLLNLSSGTYTLEYTAPGWLPAKPVESQLLVDL